MQGPPNGNRQPWRLALLVLALAGITALLLHRLAAPWEETRPIPAPLVATVESPSATKAAAPGPPPAPAPAVAEPAPVFNEPPAISPVPKIEISAGMLPWEQQIARVLAGDSSPRSKALVLFSMLPSLPPEATQTATETALEVLRDPDYAAIARPVLVNPNTNGAVLGVLFADLMQRPDPVALPALLEIARSPTHPYAEYARDNLALLLGHDWAADWPAWEAAMRQRLAGSPR